MTEPVRQDVTIPVPDYFHDHHLEGQAVVPAVESMCVLADAAGERLGISGACSVNAGFRRFFYVEPGAGAVEAVLELKQVEDGVHAMLGAGHTAQKTGITRVKDHVTLTFVEDLDVPVPPLELACAAVGPALAVDTESLYSEVVPFGPAFHNLRDTVYLTPDGVIATIVAPRYGPPCGALGSPFVFDAALHAACAWGQRYTGAVTFPVGYGMRKVFTPTEQGSLYFCRIFPGEARGRMLTFDIYIYDEDGELVEAICEVRMQDLFSGRMSPAEWVYEREPPDFSVIEDNCRAFLYMNNRCLMPFANKCLSPTERRRAEQRMPARRPQCASARILIKQLVREELEVDASLHPREIETALEEETCARCMVCGEASEFHCTSAHAVRYTAAVLDDSPVGVHVERATDRPLRRAQAFLSSEEQNMCWDSPLGAVDAACRMWSLKKAAAKALGIPLVQSWAEVRVARVREKHSLAEYGDLTLAAHHALAHDHLFTLVKL
ncbi:MAG: polyketide synthase dehydratase domain-containing protein [Desulfatibacillaceae bacterium]